MGTAGLEPASILSVHARMNPCPILRGLPSSLHYLPQHTSCLNDSVCCRFCFRRLLLSCFFTDYSQGRLHNCSLYAPPCSSVPIHSATIRTLLLFACYYSPTSWLVRGRTRYKVTLFVGARFTQGSRFFTLPHGCLIALLGNSFTWTIQLATYCAFSLI